MYDPMSFVNNPNLRYKQQMEIYSVSELKEKLSVILEKAYWKVIAMVNISPKKVLVIFERFT